MILWGLRVKLYNMDRYQYITNTTPTDSQTPMYVTVKYPSIPLGSADVFVYTSRGDRYDILASFYYGDSSLWWIIPSANPGLTFDSLIPPIGIQIRIPAPTRFSEIISMYNRMN